MKVKKMGYDGGLLWMLLKAFKHTQKTNIIIIIKKSLRRIYFSFKFKICKIVATI